MRIAYWKSGVLDVALTNEESEQLGGFGSGVSLDIRTKAREIVIKKDPKSGRRIHAMKVTKKQPQYQENIRFDKINVRGMPHFTYTDVEPVYDNRLGGYIITLDYNQITPIKKSVTKIKNSTSVDWEAEMRTAIATINRLKARHSDKITLKINRDGSITGQMLVSI